MVKKEREERVGLFKGHSLFSSLQKDVKEHLDMRGYNTEKVDVTDTQLRYRQFDPGLCQPDSFRSKEIGKHETGVFCRKEGESTLSLQSVVVPKRKGRLL